MGSNLDISVYTIVHVHKCITLAVKSSIPKCCISLFGRSAVVSSQSKYIGGAIDGGIHSDD